MTAAAIKGILSSDNTMWSRPPISKRLLESAAEDVSQLLAVAKAMAPELGSIMVGHVLALSNVYAQTHWDASDRDIPKHGLSVFHPTRLVPWLERLYTQVPDLV